MPCRGHYTRQKGFDMTATESNNIRLVLYHGTDDSVIFIKDDRGILGRKYYTKRIHKYESTSDFKRLETELQTYGYQQGLLPEWNRLQTK